MSKIFLRGPYEYCIWLRIAMVTKQTNDKVIDYIAASLGKGRKGEFDTTVLTSEEWQQSVTASS